MYHLQGLPTGTTLQLSSESVCALMTGSVTNWDSPVVQADNPGVTLPSTPVTPVIRADPAGTDLALQEYCIHEQPTLWSSFVTSPGVTGYPGQVADLSATTPHPDWPFFAGAVIASGAAAAADDVAAAPDDGYITAVEPAYATQRHYPVASVENASGRYTQPTPVDVESALAYASEGAGGTPVLDFDATGPDVYEPSTFDDLLAPTTGSDPGKGAVLSAFVDYALTLGQEEAPSIGFDPLGRPLEHYGVNTADALIPGAVTLDAAESAAYSCGALSVADVQAGRTTPSCTGPPPVLAEAPGIVLLPVVAAVLAGATFLAARRRRRRSGVAP